MLYIYKLWNAKILRSNNSWDIYCYNIIFYNELLFYHVIRKLSFSVNILFSISKNQLQKLQILVDSVFLTLARVPLYKYLRVVFSISKSISDSSKWTLLQDHEPLELDKVLVVAWNKLFSHPWRIAIVVVPSCHRDHHLLVAIMKK